MIGGVDWSDPDGRPERRGLALAVVRWTAAAGVVAAAHGAAIWVALERRPVTPAGDPPPALMLELAPIMAAPQAPPQETPPGPQMTETPAEAAPEAERPRDEPDPTPEPVAEQTQPVEEEPPLPAPPQVEIARLPERERAEAILPPPKPQKPPPPRQRQAERKKPVQTKRPPAPQTTAPPTAQAQRVAEAAAPSASSSQTPSMSPASWRGALNAHLNRHKRFPGGAAGTGVARIAFTIDRAGRVLSSRLVGSSGDPILDAEAVALPRRASPVPAPPANVLGQTLSLAVPVRFNR